MKVLAWLCVALGTFLIVAAFAVGGIPCGSNCGPREEFAWEAAVGAAIAWASAGLLFRKAGRRTSDPADEPDTLG